MRRMGVPKELRSTTDRKNTVGNRVFVAQYSADQRLGEIIVGGLEFVRT